MDKNNDALTVDLAELMDSSKDPFTRGLFTPKAGEERPQRGKITLISLGAKFKVALEQLMDKLRSTRSSFIRCIKPNQKMQPKIFNGGEILSQLQCAGMVSVLDLMQGGFPSRTAFKDLYDMYSNVLPPALKQLEPRIFCKALFKALGLSEEDFQFGVSKVFFRPGKFAEFDTIMKADPENLVTMVNKVVDWLLKQRWKKIAWASVSCLKFAAKIRARAGAAVTVQKVIRMYLSRSVHEPRYIGVRNISNLRAQIPTLIDIVDKLPKNKEKFLKSVEECKQHIDDAVNKIKGTPTIDRNAINKMGEEIQKALDKNMQAITKEQEKQKLAEEAERLKRLAEEMERERLRKEKEEQERVAAEEEARRLREMEQLRKAEADAEEKRLEAARIQAEKDDANKKLQAQRLAEAKRIKEEQDLIEQERRDQELAMRLAQDQGSQAMNALSAETQASLAAGRQTLKRDFGSAKKEAIHKKHDLSKWKYADLRDTINTSCDIELLEACREEFHRRLKVYHAWKMKNAKKAKEGEADRAPPALHAAAQNRGAAPPPPKKKASERPQRYFRIPFVRPGDNAGASDTKQSQYKKRGWWYAHFDGQWIARQMELHPDKPPVLLVAGKDDMEMCELSLDETGLSRKRGAEILPREFEEEWRAHGGQPYVRATPAKKK